MQLRGGLTTAPASRWRWTYLRMLLSFHSARSENSFSSYQLESHVRKTPRRKPIGLTFCPKDSLHSFAVDDFFVACFSFSLAAIFFFSIRCATIIVTWFERFTILYARPIGAGSILFKPGPPSTNVSFTKRESASTRFASSLFWRLETADRRTFSATFDACFVEKCSIFRASGTDLPRMRSITSRIFRGDEPIYLLIARASNIL